MWTIGAELLGIKMSQNTYLGKKKQSELNRESYGIAASHWEEKSPSGLRSLELAFEKWVEWGGWEDIAKVRNSQNEVVGPDVQVLPPLSHALSVPAPHFPSLQSVGNDIVHHL